MTETLRKTDDPIYKERVCSEIYGRFIGFLTSKGLIHGIEYDTQVSEVFQCSQKLIWVDEVSRTHQITIHINSLRMDVEFGVIDKQTKKVIYRTKIENLRYKISSETNLSLITSHQLKFNVLFSDFTDWYSKILL